MFDALVRFQEHKVALLGDIQKTFLQIEVNTEDIDYLQFLWVRNMLSEESEVKFSDSAESYLVLDPAHFY